MDAYDKAVRIQKIREKTQQKNIANNDDSNKNEHSPTPPPIDGLINDTKSNTNNNDDPTTSIKPTQQNQIQTMINPTVNNMYSHLYTNPLLMNPYKIAASMYSDTFDPLNPSNPKYNNINKLNINPQHKFRQFVNIKSPMINSPIINSPIIKSPTIKPQPPSNIYRSNIYPSNTYKNTNKQKNEDITKMSKPKREIEVIMDPKLRSLMPSSMRFKRKFDKPTQVRPKKKRKLDIAPDVDDKNAKNSSKLISNEKQSVNSNNLLDNGNADAAYDKFMNEINDLL